MVTRVNPQWQQQLTIPMPVRPNERARGSGGVAFFVTALVLAVSLLTTIPAHFVSAFASVVSTTTPTATNSVGSSIRVASRLCASGGNNKNNKNLSSSDRERRDEDRRRKERKDDVVIGKTSAKRDATDYPIDPEATEREYLLRASREERLVHQYTEEGMNAMKSLRLELANKYFDKVFEVRPEAYLWQAGIVKFYLGDTIGASRIFAKNAIHFETKFGPMGMGPASEERIWRNAAELKYVCSLKRSERKEFLLAKEEGTVSTITQIDDGDDDDDIGVETRKVHRLAREMFDASADQRKSVEVVARAKLLSFAGNDDKAKNSKSSNNFVSQDIKKRKLNACYFLALHYDVMGDVDESKKWIKTAFKLCTNAGKSSDIMDTLPLLHMTARDWFDDDPYDEEDDGFDDCEFEDSGAFDNDATGSTTDSDRSEPVTASKSKGKSKKNSNHMSDAYSDPVLEASIMEDVEKMKFIEIRDALRIRGISVTGSKETLKERLFISLMDDAGYQSGFAP